MTQTPTVDQKTGRDCVPYTLRPVLELVRDNQRDIDLRLEDVGTSVLAALADDGVIDRAEATHILNQLAPAARANVEGLSVVNLMLEAGKEAAQRETERIQALRQQLRRKLPRKPKAAADKRPAGK